MIFETKFDLEQKIYPLVRVIVPHSCSKCDGGKLLLADGRKLTCRDCQGSGTISGSVKKVLWEVGPEEVVDAIVVMSDCETYQVAGVSDGLGNSREWDVEDIFATTKLAEMECEKRNKPSTDQRSAQ